MSKSKIEWTELTWNPVTGCNKVSPGCKYCYAEPLSSRLKAMGLNKYKNEFKVTLHKNELERPYKWRKPRVVFVNSMSDLFHSKVPDKFILKVFKVMNECPNHIFQVLTKREERLLQLSDKINWTPNIWMGVSVENSDYLNRVRALKKTKAHIKFISFEPLLGPIKRISLRGINWVIVGGESGPNSRPIEKGWVEGIQELSDEYSIPFFFKQWGGKNKKKTGRKLNGKYYNKYPKEYKMRISK